MKSIHNEISNAHQLMGIWIWQYDANETDPGHTFFDVNGLYMWYYRKIIMRGKKYGKYPLSRIAKITGISLPRLRKARSILLKNGIVKEARLKDKMGYNKESIIWLPHATKPGEMKKIAKKAGFTFHKMNHKKHKSKPSYRTQQDGKNGVEKPKSHPIAHGKSHPIAQCRVYNGILKNKRNGILKNKRGGSHQVLRNNPSGYKRPLSKLSITDPKNPKNKKYRGLAIKLMEVIKRDSKYNMKPNETKWVRAIRLFCIRDMKTKDIGIQIIKGIIRYHDHDPGVEPFLTRINQPEDLKRPEKLDKLLNFVERINGNGSSWQKDTNNSRVVIKSNFDHSKTTYTDL